MKKTLTRILAVLAIAGTLAATVTNADAQFRRRGIGVGPAIGLGVLGGVIVGSAIASTYGRQYVVEPGYEPYEAYRVRGPVNCPGGYWARQPLLDRFGNVRGYSRPRFFCPEY
jgi:hypothetical protein